MNVKELMNIALKLADLEEMPADTVIQWEGSRDIKKILAGIDMGTTEVFVAHQTGYDCVARHHPQDVVMSNVGGMMEMLHINHMMHHGVPPTIAQKLMNGTKKQMFQSTHVANYTAVSQMAKFLNIASLSIHTPADLIVERHVQGRMDELIKNNPLCTLKDIIDNLMEIREYASTPQCPGIWVGDEQSYAGKIVVAMAGGGAPSLEEYQAYIDAGAGTFICMHMKKEIQDVLSKEKRCNVVVAGHMASDSFGFNRILDAWEEAGVEVTRIGGIV